MKKNIIIYTIMIVLMALLIIVGLYKNQNVVISDSEKFKKEYESLNGIYDEERKHEYVEVEIKEDNPIVYASYEDIVNILENGTGVIYFGFKECPWCRNAVPVLIDAASELGIDKIYYYDNKNMRDKKSLDEDNNIIVEEEGTKEYQKLVELMYDYLPTYEGLNDDTIKRLYFPTVVFVKDGKIINLHTSTVNSQEDPYKNLTNTQYAELKQIYMDGFNEVYDILCDQSC